MHLYGDSFRTSPQYPIVLLQSAFVELLSYMSRLLIQSLGTFIPAEGFRRTVAWWIPARPFQHLPFHRTIPSSWAV